jgi:hypothetical protein
MDVFNCLSLFDPRRLEDWYLSCNQRFLNRRRLDSLSTPDRFVGLRHNANDLMLRLQQSLQRRHTDFARADENNAHAELRRQFVNHTGTTRASPGHCLRKEFFAGCDLAPAYGRSAAGAKIIENLPIRQDEKQPLTHRHRRLALLAVEA